VTSASPARSDLGEPSGASEVEALRETLRALLGRLGEALDQSRGFAANAPHDVRTPLGLLYPGDVVRDVLGTYDAAKRLRISATFDAPGMVRGDDALLRVVVDNLLDNALKFDAAGAVQVTVAERSDTVSVVVTDDGPGIAVSDWKRVLRPFERGNGGAPGHGLGLAIAAHVVTLHQGQLELVPSARGTEIRIVLPAWARSS
jgi:signal transduction histidine kinase